MSCFDTWVLDMSQFLPDNVRCPLAILIPVQEQWLQLKVVFLLGCNLKIFIKWGGAEGIDFWWEGNKNLVEGGSLLVRIFPGRIEGGDGVKEFSVWGGGGDPSLSSKENPVFGHFCL